MKSIEEMDTLLNTRIERVALKGKKFVCGKPATEENIQKVEEDTRKLIHPEITNGKFTKYDLYKFEAYRERMERHCIEHQYVLQVIIFKVSRILCRVRFFDIM